MNEKDSPVLTGSPSAMCSYKDKLYLFFDKAYQVLQFEGEKSISSTALASWEKPNNCVAQDDYIWISAANGLFALHFEDQQLKVLHADSCQGWDKVHALGIYKDKLFIVSDVIKQFDTSSCITKTIDEGDWSQIVCGAQYGNFLYMPSKKGPLWRYDMEKNSHEQISDNWSTCKGATFIEGVLFLIADGIWLIDCGCKKKTRIGKEDCSNVILCASLGNDIYAVKQAGTFWKYSVEVKEKRVELEWTNNLNVPQDKPSAEPTKDQDVLKNENPDTGAEKGTIWIPDMSPYGLMASNYAFSNNNRTIVANTRAPCIVYTIDSLSNDQITTFNIKCGSKSEIMMVGIVPSTALNYSGYVDAKSVGITNYGGSQGHVTSNGFGPNSKITVTVDLIKGKITFFVNDKKDCEGEVIDYKTTTYFAYIFTEGEGIEATFV